MAAFAEGEPCWADAVLPDLEAGKRFYGELLGWSFQDGGKEYGYYTLAFHDRRSVAAFSLKRDGRMPTVWNIYVSTRDAAATCERIREAGGQVIVDPMPVGLNFGGMAMAVDPGGAVFALWQGFTHAGFEQRGEPGSYAWTELYTRDRAGVDPFYEHVFGYARHDLGAATEPGHDEDGGSGYALWSPAGRPPGLEHAVIGRCVMGVAFPAETPAHFLIYFAVRDCDAAAETAARLGGRVTHEPEDTAFGRFALLADDQGAHFAVINLASSTSRNRTRASELA